MVSDATDGEACRAIKQRVPEGGEFLRSSSNARIQIAPMVATVAAAAAAVLVLVLC